MSDLSPEEYQKQYNEATEALDAGAAPAIPPKKEEAGLVQAPADPEVPKVDDVPAPVDEAAVTRDRIAQLEKQVADNKAWATKEAQKRAEIERKWQQEQREANRPAILDANPDLVEAIKFVTTDPAPQQQAEKAHQTWIQTIESVHPGIFASDADPELVEALVKKRDENPGAWEDPLVAIRDIAAEKVAHAQRQTEKKFQVEAAAQKAKSAMSVPGTGGGGKREAVDSQTEEANRIKNMSDADFDKMVKKVKGF